MFMSWQKNIRMKLGYRFLGNFVANLLNRPYINYLRTRIPGKFFHKAICDLGCGDGFVTSRVKEIFLAKKIKGYELNDYLIKRARKRGLDIKKTNLEKEIPRGEMAVVWGVVHHLKNKRDFLEKVRNNFDYAFLAEPIKNFWSFLDGGEPLSEEDWKKLFSEALDRCQFIKFKDDLFVFWNKHVKN